MSSYCTISCHLSDSWHLGWHCRLRSELWMASWVAAPCAAILGQLVLVAGFATVDSTRSGSFGAFAVGILQHPGQPWPLDRLKLRWSKLNWRIRLLVRDRTSSWTEHNPRGLHLLTKFNYKHQDLIFVHFVFFFFFFFFFVDSAFIADRFTEVVWSIDATADGEIDRSKFWLTSGHKICSIDNPRSWRFYDR
uniref:(northern house mosquito) hypothetical protein n=1 Tax=Culex pipiens TaxID=7175 RepID=A0A8D8ACL8_CULPI